MSKTNQEIIKDWRDSHNGIAMDYTEAMSAAREDELEQVRGIVEKRLDDYNTGIIRASVASERWKRLVAVRDELKLILKLIK